MKKLAYLSNPILIAFVGFFFLVVYFLAIKPTIELNTSLSLLKNQNQQQNDINDAPKGSLKELQRLDFLLAKLQPKEDVQTIVLQAVSQRNLILKSFQEEKLPENLKDLQDIKQYQLVVSGNYKDLLAVIGDLKDLAISSSAIEVNEEQEKILSIVILTQRDIN